MKNFLHLKFVRNLKSDLEILQEQKKIMNYLLFDYFDYLLVEQADNLQECAFGIKSPEKRQELCEAYQGLGIFCLQDQTEQVEIKPNLIRAYPFVYGDGDMPFLSIFQLTLNPYYYKKEQETEADEWIETLKTKILDSFDENKDSVAFQIYQTVNAIDFCIIVVSKHLAFTERLSNNLKRCTFDLDKNKYLAFTVYENVGIHRDVKDDLIADAFSGQHALVARVKVKDHYWSGLKGEYSKEWDKTCRCSVLNGRYHFSARIENQQEILLTLKEIIAYKFGEPIKNIEEEVNIIRRILMEGKVEYLNERILFNGETETYAFSGQTGMEISVPEYQFRDEKIFDRLKRLYDLTQDIEGRRELQIYIEKLENVYCMQKGLAGNSDTHISCKMFAEYFLAFLDCAIMTLELIGSNKELLAAYIMQIKFGLRYLTQFTDIICSVNTTTFQAPKYELIQDMNANPKFAIAYTEFLKERVKEYRDRSKENEEKKYFPYYIPLIISNMSEITENFFMVILFAQGFTDDWENESAAWEKYVASEKKTPLFVVCEKYKTFVNISDVLTLSFHELGHYCNYLTREQRNTDLLEMISKSLTGKVMQEYRNAKEIEHFLNRSETIKSSRIKQFQILNYFLKEGIYEILKRNVEENGLKGAPESLFIAFVIQRSKALFTPVPTYYSRANLNKKAFDFIIEKTNYHYGNDVFSLERLEKIEGYQNKGNYICECVFQNCQNEVKGIKEEFKEIKYNSSKFYLEGVQEFEAYLDLLQKIVKCYSENGDKNELKKLSSEFSESTKKMEEILKNIRNNNLSQPYIIEENELFGQLQNLYGRTARVVRLLWEYDFLKTSFFENSQVFESSIFDMYGEKEALIQGICQNMQRYFKENEKALDHLSNVLTLWERQMLERLQLTNNMEPEHFCTMLNDAFLRVGGIDQGIQELSKIYSEAFADLSMCKELNLDLKEYLIVMAQYVKFSPESGHKFRLKSIIIVTIIKMLEDELREKHWEVFYKDCPGNTFLELFRTKNEALIQKIHYDTAKKSKVIQKNEFAKKFLALIDAIEKSIVDVVSDTSLHPILERMRGCIDGETTQSCNENIGFVKNSLNYIFEESFSDISRKEKEDRKNQILKEEIRFMMKYYYKNRRRYMEEDKGI